MAGGAFQESAMPTVLARLKESESDPRVVWQADFSAAPIFRRMDKGVREEFTLDPLLFRSLDPRVSHLVQSLSHFFQKAGELKIGDVVKPILSPSDLAQAILTEGQKGLSVQRYKGLGEMNPDQLWETTLDANQRALLQVKVNHIDSAEQVFVTLMGDLVEPRRDFIQNNALKVANLDV